MENSRKKQFVSFKLHAILSSTVKALKSHFFLQDVSHLFDQRICCVCSLPVSPLVAILVIRSTIEVSRCLCSVTFILFKNGPKHKSSDVDNLDISKRSCKSLPLSEKVKESSWLNRKEKSHTLKWLKCTIRTNVPMKLWRRKKKLIGFELLLTFHLKVSSSLTWCHSTHVIPSSYLLTSSQEEGWVQYYNIFWEKGHIHMTFITVIVIIDLFHS